MEEFFGLGLVEQIRIIRMESRKVCLIVIIIEKRPLFNDKRIKCTPIKIASVI
jgi:hypothetical protein